MYSDDELYRGFIAGDTTAYDKLMIRYGDSLTCYLKGFLYSLEDAEDMMIEAFAEIMAKKPMIKEGNFKSYLFRVGHNLVYHHYKKTERLEVFSLDEIDEELPDGENFEDKILKDEREKALHRCISRIDPELREAIWLVFFENLSYENASEIMGIKKKKLDNLLMKAKKQLKAELEKEGIRN